MPPTVLYSLNALRLEADVAQTELAEAIGVRQATVSKWENGGIVRADFDILDRLCRFLSAHLERQVTLADLRKKPRGI